MVKIIAQQKAMSPKESTPVVTFEIPSQNAIIDVQTNINEQACYTLDIEGDPLSIIANQGVHVRLIRFANGSSRVLYDSKKS